MENKNNGVLIGLVVILIIVILGLVGYIVYNKELALDNENKIEENNKENETNREEAAEQSVPTDMNLVSSKLNELDLGAVISRYVYSHGLENGQNLLDNSSAKLDLLNAYFMKNSLASWTNFGDGRQDFPYVSIDTYKNKYKEVYGSLDKFEYDTNNASGLSFHMADKYDSSLSGNVAWNGTWGVAGFKLALKATNIVYDDINQDYIISGNIISTDWDTNSKNNGNFNIVYVNTNEVKYMKSVTISNYEK